MWILIFYISNWGNEISANPACTFWLNVANDTKIRGEYFLTLRFIYINLPFDLTWNIAVASGLMLTGICWITYTNVYVRLLVAGTCSLQFPDNFFECSHFVGLALNGLKWEDQNYLDRLHIFATFPIRYKSIYVKSFFPRTAWLWNSLPAKCFLLKYDCNGFNSNRLWY